MRRVLLLLALLVAVLPAEARERYRGHIELELGIGPPSSDGGPIVRLDFRDARPKHLLGKKEELVGEAPRKIYARRGDGARVAQEAVELAFLEEGFVPLSEGAPDGVPTITAELLTLYSQAGGAFVMRHHKVSTSVRVALRLPGEERAVWSETVSARAGVAIGGTQRLYAIADAYSKALRQMSEALGIQLRGDGFRDPLCRLPGYLECAPAALPPPAPVTVTGPVGAPPVIGSGGPATVPTSGARDPAGYAFSATITGLRSGLIETSSGHALQISASHAAVSNAWRLGAPVTLQESILENQETGEAVLVTGLVPL